MKYLPYLILLWIFTCSCHIAKLPYTHTITQPYVQTKDGQKIFGSNVKRKGPFVWGKVTIDGQKFRPKDVAFYADGKEVYANVGRRDFATQVAAGPINLYRTIKIITDNNTNNFGATSSFNGGRVMYTSQHKHSYYYVQQGEGNPVKYLKYKRLKPMVAAGTPAGKVLEKFRTRRIGTRGVMYGALGCLVGGAIIAGTAPETIALGGVVVFLTGFLSLFPGVLMSGMNQQRLITTVVTADKDYVPSKPDNPTSDKPARPQNQTLKNYDLNDYIK